VVSSEWHYEMPDVLDHAADNNVLFSQFRILHSLKNDVLLVDRLGHGLAQVEPVSSLNVVNVDIKVLFVAFESVELSCNDIFLVGVEGLEACVVLVVHQVIFKDCLCILQVVGNNVAVVSILIIL